MWISEGIVRLFENKGSEIPLPRTKCPENRIKTVSVIVKWMQ